MNLNYISLGLDYNTYINENNELRYSFQQHTNFINDYFSKKIRKLKYKTDGSFNMLAISVTEFEIKDTSIVPDKALKTNLTFDKAKYDKIKGTNDCSYYLELIENGFKKANRFKPIPLNDLLQIIQEFKDGDCKNEWQHKKKRSKNDDIEVILTCQFTTNYFQLIITINQISTKQELAKGVIIKTETGISIHEGMFKDIVIDKDILITDKSDSPRIRINKKAIFKGELKFNLIGDKETKKILSYNL
ncbi:conserved hypothetical protein [Tenacibaculum sp. 190130A14a]|uniref:hypothetical protein n=1 Tax=Tenacibaculum polynesiense TaxID=3137857 RepID=UPI003200973F